MYTCCICLWFIRILLPLREVWRTQRSKLHNLFLFLSIRITRTLSEYNKNSNTILLLFLLSIYDNYSKSYQDQLKSNPSKTSKRQLLFNIDFPTSPKLSSIALNKKLISNKVWKQISDSMFINFKNLTIKIFKNSHLWWSFPVIFFL